MAHGTPDWGVTAGARTVYQLTDLGELAVRLGSPIAHDRRGDVVWWDDFEWSLNKWTPTLSGTGAAAAISSTFARNGQSSCLLTGGSDGPRTATILHRQSYLTMKRGGAEISVHFPGTIDYFLLALQLATVEKVANFQLKYDDTNNELQYQNAGGGYTAFQTVIPLTTSATLFHTFKLVADIEAEEYVRAIVNSRAYDLSGISKPAGASGGIDQMAVSLIVGSRAGNNDQVYVDDAIFTINEPA